MELFFYIWPIISLALMILLGLILGRTFKKYMSERSKNDIETGKTQD